MICNFNQSFSLRADACRSRSVLDGVVSSGAFLILGKEL